MKRYSEAELQIIREWFPHVPTGRQAVDLGRDTASLAAKANAMGLHKSDEYMRNKPGQFKPGQALRGRAWTEHERDILRTMYPTHTAKEIAPLVGRNSMQVSAMANKMGLHKGPEFFASPKSGRCSTDRPVPGSETARFQKGHETWNKGTKGLTGSNESSFKAGHMPHNWCPVGTIRPTTRDNYLRIKVAEPNVWEFVHLRTWVAANGQVPDGHVVSFKDGNHENCSLDNLQLKSMDEHMRGNSIHKYPKDLQDALRALWMLQRRIEKHGQE